VFFWLFSPKKEKKNEQHTTDNEIKLHETDRKMNSTTRQIFFFSFFFFFFAFTAEREAIECKGKHKHQKAKEERAETEPEKKNKIEKENSLKQCRE
jgi:hypothetical protein